jgi:hypothetical protein
MFGLHKAGGGRSLASPEDFSPQRYCHYIHMEFQKTREVTTISVSEPGDGMMDGHMYAVW